MNKELLEILVSAALKNGGQGVTVQGVDSFFRIGQAYLIRTVTMAWTGRVRGINSQEIELEEACWIADTGRYNEAVKGVWGNSAEHEPVPSGVFPCISRGSIVDFVPLSCELPKAVK